MSKVRKVMLWNLSVIFLCFSCGCSGFPFGYTIVNSTGQLEKKADIRLIGQPTDDRMHLTEADRRQSPSRVAYHPSYSQNRWMVVEGQLGNGKKYPVVLDTGASPPIFVNDIHIIENKLPIHPFKDDSGNSTGWGMCCLPELRIGQVTLRDGPCFYREQHMEVQLFGLPIAKDKAVIVGLASLREFKYIVFDSVQQEAEFSLEQTFEPAEPALWAQYPFAIEEDWSGNPYLFVNIPIAGEQIELQLDTGSGRGLAISDQLWQQIRPNIQNVKLSKGIDLYPYIGQLPCRRGLIDEIELGDKIVSDAKISVFPDDSPLLDYCDGMLGMQYFQDTVMVLDFERNLMWVKNQSDT